MFRGVLGRGLANVIVNAPVQRRGVRPVRCNRLCTPGTGVNLWGESPLYMNPVSG